jgi:hypothetical protein
VQVDLDIRADVVGINAFNLAIDGIDPNTSYIPDEYIDHAKGSVVETVRSRILGLNESYRAKTSYLGSALHLPSEILSLPIQLLKGDFDPEGYLVLYFAYGDRY